MSLWSSFLCRPVLGYFCARVAIQAELQNNVTPSLSKRIPTSSPCPSLEISGTYVERVYGHLKIVDLQACASTFASDESIQAILRHYRASEPFGKTINLKPSHLAVFPVTTFWYIYELYHWREGRYYGSAIQLLPRNGDSAAFMRIPNWVCFFAQ